MGDLFLPSPLGKGLWAGDHSLARLRPPTVPGWAPVPAQSSGVPAY